MGIKKRIYAILLVIGMVGGVFGVAKSGLQLTSQREKEQQENFLSRKKDTLRIWYTDESLTDYLNSAAVAFYEQTDTRVEPVLASSKEFLENVYHASVHEEEAIPDLYLVTNDCLEKAYLSGIAAQIDDRQLVGEEQFGKAGICAVTYQDKKVGYPLYYETSVLLYNKTYLMDYAHKQLQAEYDLAVAEQSQAAAEAGEVEEQAETAEVVTKEFSAREIEQRMKETLPDTIEHLEVFADEYDAPEQVEGVFRWDVSDILYNYNYAGNYMSVGGDNGDDPEKIDIYNLETIQCLDIFQNLNQFFYIEAKDASYEKVIQDFIEGKTVFTVVGTDILEKLRSAKEQGTLLYEYGLREMPDLDDTLKSRSRSITTVVAVNGFSGQQDKANQFAQFLTMSFADGLYSRAGKLPAYGGAKVEMEGSEVFYAEYTDSVPMPKLMTAGNFWVKLEIAFTEIWEGADVNQTLKSLSEEFMTQMKGETFKEQYIEYQKEEPEEELSELEE